MSSTAKNLMFLEAMLGRYMHEHYIDETDSAMYTKPVGFRMPHTRGITDLERNMKYVEVQLDKFLHTHEQADVGSYAWAVPSEGTKSGIDARWVAASNTEFWLLANAVFPAVSPTVYRYSLSDGSLLSSFVFTDLTDATAGFAYDAATDSLWILGDPTDVSGHQTAYNVNKSTGASIGSVSMPLEGGVSQIDYITVGGSRLWVAGNGSTYVYGLNKTTGAVEVQNSDWMATYSAGQVKYDVERSVLWLYESATASLYQADGTLFASADISNQLSWFDYAITPNGEYAISVNPQGGDTTYGIYAISIPVTTLYWTPKGFRFPYDWKRPDAINNNRRFLETELSQYLHEHEAVTT